MPTNTFHSFGDDDVIEAVHVSEMHAPIQNLERGASYYAGLSTGTSSAYAVTMSPPPDSPYQSGMLVNFKPHVGNSFGTVTLDVNGMGPKPMGKNGSPFLFANELIANQIVSFVYDASGTGQFQLMMPTTTAGTLDSLSDVAITNPSAGQIVQYNGSNFENSLPMGFNLFGNVSGKLVPKRSLNSPSGMTDIGSPPSGKRWLILGCYVFAPTGLSGSRTFTAGFKFSGTFVGTYQSTLSAGNTLFPINLYYPILESTDTLSHNTNGAGLSVFYEILEFPTSVPLKTAKLTSLSSGNNVLYTCPAGKTAQPVSHWGMSNPLAFNDGSIVYRNNSGATRNVYWNHCKSGESAAAPGVGSNSLTGFSYPINAGNFNYFGFYGGLEAGDFISFNTDSGTSTQMVWVNIQEF